jgi:hypothetical protein
MPSAGASDLIRPGNISPEPALDTLIKNKIADMICLRLRWQARVIDFIIFVDPPFTWMIPEVNFRHSKKPAALFGANRRH